MYQNSINELDALIYSFKIVMRDTPFLLRGEYKKVSEDVKTMIRVKYLLEEKMLKEN